MADSKNIDDGGPAFPQHDLSGYGFGPSERGEHGESGEPEDFGTRHYTIEGMSLRDHFASQALPQFIMINERATTGRENASYDLVLKVIATQAYAMADAMIAARKTGGRS